MNRLSNMKKFFLLCVNIFFFIYSFFVSPVLHLFAGANSGCRFEPTCSAYVKRVFTTHNIIKGAWLSIYRLLRCQPFSFKSTSYFDPAPLPYCHKSSFKG
ncbi:MAG: membrane protein insertion efficiency factor YidD [Candidatus Poribacteria bacterium]